MSETTREEGTDREPSADPVLPDLRVAIVHDWLTGMRGGERCLEEFCRIFPRAEVFTLVHVPGSVSRVIEDRRIHVSWLDRLPGVRRRYRQLLPLFPRAVRSLDVTGFDLILSSSHCAAKGVPPRGLPHICYCHTPMRYVWDRFDDYFGPGRPLPVRAAARLLRRRLQKWDRLTAGGVDRFVANSAHVAARIRRYYDRRAEVIHPPVDTDRFRPGGEPEERYLIVSALAPYKRIDLAIEACRRLGRRLLILGRGQDERRLRRLARGAEGIELRGWCSDSEVEACMRRCRALILPGEEDFGITPLEAMASGRPVVALGRGGATETVVDPAAATPDRPATGILFEEPTVSSLERAIERLEAHLDQWRPERIRAHAERFAPPRFRREIAEAVRRFLAGR